MLSRDLEVAALSIQTRRLVDEAQQLVESLRKHERDLNNLIGDVREEVAEEARRE